MIDLEMVVFDLETTGVDVENDRIVTAFVGLLDENGNLLRSQEYLVDPGEDHYESLEAASKVHGWTKERLHADPRTRRGPNAPEDVAGELAHLIWALCGDPQGSRYALAGHNLSYDLTMLRAHLARAGRTMFPFGQAGVRVLDSIVLDKHYVKFLRGAGQRKLTPTAARYGVPITEEQAHDASFDAIAAGRICQAIARTKAYAHDLDQLHSMQRGWRREQQLSLQKFLRSPKGGEPDAICEPGWPVH